MIWFNKSFKILGLSDNEIKILDVLDSEKSIQDIARDTSLSRTGINYLVSILLKRGLIEYVKKGKRKNYIAIDNNKISELFKKALDEIGIINKERKGARIITSPKDEFVIHVGAKEIVPAYTRIAYENRNERIRAIQHHRSWSELVNKITKKQLVDFNESIKANHLIIDGMLNESAYKEYEKEIKSNPSKNEEAIKSLEGRMADYTLFPDNIFNYDTEIWLFKNTALIINWKEEVAIEITNTNMAGFLQDMFEYVKSGGSKLNHNEKIKDIINKQES